MEVGELVNLSFAVVSGGSLAGYTLADFGFAVSDLLSVLLHGSLSSIS